MAEVRPPSKGSVDQADIQPPNPQAAYLKDIDDITHSDIGLTSLLDRLKQSLASAREFAGFLKKRSSVEEEHAKALKRLARSTTENLHHAESRQGTYSRQVEEALRTHEKMADNGMQFALSLHQMHEDLTELTNNVERGRKTWKHQSLDAEKKYTDAESLMNRAKTKYDGLAEDYDRAKTGDVKGSRKFIKGPKSAAQYEEDVLRKLQAADTDYADKVAAAKSQRQELTQSYRPRASKAIQELINECDSGLTLQLQKFATFNEKLLLGNGILITPLPSENASNRSLREIMTDIDNEKDLHHYILAQKSRVPPKAAEIQYVKHPLLAPKQQSTPAAAPAPVLAPAQTQAPLQSQPINPPTSSFSTFPQGQAPGQGPTPNLPPVPQKDEHFMSSGSGPASPYGVDGQNGRPHDLSSTQSPIRSPAYPPQQQIPPQQQLNQKRSFNDPPYPMGGPSDNRLPSPNRANPPLQMPYNNGGPPGVRPGSAGGAAIPPPQSTAPPTNPVFGVTLEELFARDGSAVPMVVYQCMQAVDVFGLSVEGIYRQNGTAAHIAQLKSAFDHDASRIDFRNPAAFHHDVNSVAGLLKLFFRDLPDPLLTRDRYPEFLAAARIDDDTVRRDTLHAIINGLPDANYATLRALVLHLHRVQDHQAENRMTSSNLAICFAPSLLGAGTQMQDTGLLARVVDTILLNTYQIFDED